jgi:glycosyltransferase involved in cell wall biosynthesis
MKILLAAPHFPPRHIGGVEIYTKRLADHLRDAGHSPEVICVERIDSEAPPFHVALDTAHGYPVHRLSFPVSGSVEKLKESYQIEAVEQWTKRLLDESSPDVVHLHSGYLLGGAVLSAAHQQRVPTIVTLHDCWFVCPRITLLNPSGQLCSGPESAAKCAWCLATAQRRFRLPDTVTGGQLGRTVIKAIAHPSIASATRWSPAIRAVTTRAAVLRDALMDASLVLSPSRFLRDLITDTCQLPVDRVVLSRYGIDVPTLKRRMTGTHKGLGLRIGYLGQIAPHKGVDVLIQAVRRLPRAPLRLRIYGDLQANVRYADELKNMSNGDPRITLEGAYRHEHVYDLLSALDAIVVPSIWYENSPFVIQEAQAAHVPVIGSRLGGIPELIIDGHDGLLFEPGDARDLAKQLHRLLDEPTLLDRLRPDGTSVRTQEDEMRELSRHYRRLSRCAPDLATTLQ